MSGYILEYAYFYLVMVSSVIYKGQVMLDIV